MQVSTNDDATIPAAARDAWSATCDALLSGLAHALSNRVASLNAVVSMAPESAAAAGFSLDNEVSRLNELLRLLRALAVRPAGRAVMLDASGILAQAVELHATHATLRDVPARIADGDPVPPIVAPEGALTRALLLALTGARAAAATMPDATVVARCRAAEGRVIFEIGVPAPGEEAADAAEPAHDDVAARPTTDEGRAASALLASSGGELHERPGGRYRISVPVVRERPTPPR